MVDLTERDLLLADSTNYSSEPIFSVLWGNIFDEDEAFGDLICNILIPEGYWSMIKYVDNEFICYFNSPYVPNTRNFRVRLVGFKDGQYSLFRSIRGDFGLPAFSYVNGRNIAAPISASYLPMVDINGYYKTRFIQNSLTEELDKVYIYSAQATDLSIGFSDNQASQLLTLCAPGKSYRYPTTGVGIVRYLNQVIEHTDLQETLQSQFEADKKSIKSAQFDTDTGKLSVIATPEQEIKETPLSIDLLDVDFFTQFTDEFVRRNVVLDELSDIEFIKLLNSYPNTLNLLLFIDESTVIKRLTDSVIPGRFDSMGNIIESDEFYIVSATIDGGSIIMFDDEDEDNIDDSPIFIVNDTDETRLYTSLVAQPYWIADNCHKCFILNHRATIKYMIRQSQYQSGKGLFIVPQTSSNIKNMLGIVQDSNTGRLLGLVSNATNISDITLDEITRHIYATHINQ